MKKDRYYTLLRNHLVNEEMKERGEDMFTEYKKRQRQETVAAIKEFVGLVVVTILGIIVLYGVMLISN